MPEFHERPLVYVAGPYSHPDPILNTHAAIKEASRLQETGLVTCFVPHQNLVWHLVEPKEDDHWYAHDLSFLSRCDGVFRLPGQSTGADAEEEFARERGIPVFRTADGLTSWAADLLNVLGER